MEHDGSRQARPHFIVPPLMFAEPPRLQQASPVGIGNGASGWMPTCSEWTLERFGWDDEDTEENPLFLHVIQISKSYLMQLRVYIHL